jgi:eukaryotic-like serine/threonine-protein kinase
MTINPPDDTLRLAEPSIAPDEEHPERIGPYRIVRVLGRGGMGLVYEAEQLEPLRRTVALKVIRRGMDTREVLARFESERQALAVMDHPNIAKALDAGTTEGGLPYFVMELVQGQPITMYCDANRIDTRGRLELIIGVCQGVQHAHQKGVIHRDLKPSNILVRQQDGKSVPTIIDFGIAKAVERNPAEGGFATEVGALVGTPAYMSPEQAQASGLDIDTRSDIYSLGMVMYELVTGVLPFDREGGLLAYLGQHPLGDGDMPTPSRRIASLAFDTASDVADHRQTTPVGLRRQLRGDLDWITLKAIEHDRGRRYETANALGNDIRRYLDDKPVVARPPTKMYTVGKFVHRHRLGVAMGALAAVALIGVAVTMAVLAGRIARERTRAEREGEKAQAISVFLEDMLKSADPWQGGARQITVVEALKAGVNKLDGGAIRDPLVRASIKRTIGSVYLGLGRTAEADTLIRAALTARIAKAGPETEEAAQSLSDLGALYIAQAKFDSARPPLERALAIRRKLGGPRDTLVAASLLDLGDLAHEQGEYRREDSLARAALVLLRNSHGEKHIAVANAMRRIVSAQQAMENYKEAETMARKTARMLTALGMQRSVEMASVLNDLGLARADQKDYVEAESLLKQVVALDSVLFGSLHPDLAADLENLGYVYYQAGRYDDDIAMLKQTLAMRRAMLSPNDPAIARTLYNIAATLDAKKDYAGAEPLYEEAYARMRRALGPDHPNSVVATWTLGRNQARLGRRKEAEANLRAVLAVKAPDGKLAPDDEAKVSSILASVLIDERRYGEAEPLALRALAVWDSMPDTTRAREGAEQLVTLYDRWGKPDRAAAYRQRK